MTFSIPVFKRFSNSQLGSTAISFALASVALTGAVGASIDYATYTQNDAKLQAAADSAALAAALTPDLNGKALRKMAKKWFIANGGKLETAKSIKIKIKRVDGEVRVRVKAKTPTLMMAVLNKPYIKNIVKSRAAAGVASEPFEMVLAIDSTASMSSFGANWTRAVDAFSDLVTKLKENQEDDISTVSFVPFSDRVNVGKIRGAAWHDAPGAVSNWQGCLEPREAAADGLSFMLNDATPTTKAFKPTADGYYGPINNGGAPQCAQELSPPTHDPSEIEGAMRSITPSGTGRFDVGLAWAWRLLSPKWKNRWGLPGYPAKYKDKRKIVVMLTDGFSYAYEREVHTAGNPTQPWGWNHGTPEAFAHFAKLCENMKAKGVELHMVYLEGNAHFQPIMKACATSPAHYHDVNNIDDLESVLNGIGKTQKLVRITR